MPASYERIAGHLQIVEMRADTVLIEPGERISHVYFPAGGLVALMVPVKRDRWVEVGVVGRIGAVGICVVLGGETAIYRAAVLHSGPALRLTTEGYRASLALAPALSPLLLRYVDAFMMQISQTAACNGHHPFRQRLCRWLLISREFLESDELPFSQALIAKLLSVRLATVSEAFASLKSAGLISSGQGSLHILDPSRLEAASCVCHGIIHGRHVRLRDEYRRLAAKHRMKPRPGG